jgi:hypothetical protein
MIESATTYKDLMNLKEKGMRALIDTLGAVETINFIRLFTDGEGDYTKERENIDITEEEFLQYVKENGEYIE